MIALGTHATRNHSLPCLQGSAGVGEYLPGAFRKYLPPPTFSCLQEKKEKNAPLQVAGGA